MICGIYKITSPTGRIYIGQSRDIKKRWRGYLRKDCKYQIKLNHSFEKYGVEAHIFEIVEECEFEMLNIRERYWQEIFDCLENGLNCLLTKTEDKPSVCAKETRERMSRANSGRKTSEETKLKISRANSGKKHSEESRVKMSEATKGEKNPNFGKKGKGTPMFGKKHSEETKLKISRSGLGKKTSDETRLKISLALMGKEASDLCKKKVIDTATNKIYSSIKEAAKDINRNYGSLKNMLNGYNKNTTSLIHYNESKSQES